MKIFVLAGRVLKSLFQNPSTRRYPFTRRPDYKNTRGAVDVEIAKCIYCGLCQKKCPTQAITVNRENKTWTINRLRCISCAACLEVCPKKCLKMETHYSPAVSLKEEEVFKGA